ncbi:hypothetical protein KBY93_14480 [Synechococcus sp. J7-Johnson]|uniref:hypothetical protein n=1 Tax=Synechococcus sp. J7-Johnson TaxID=2823737 RepID=UPI0020CF1D99|nr:hypothetical protein [Synechococcus sp. J7-Johnson]MCP9841829.1 hypothetical protein [Synechococcus sp. J7-Johnson]
MTLISSATTKMQKFADIDLSIVPCQRCGCRMITKSSSVKGQMICVDCGQPVAEVPRNMGVSKILIAISLLLVLLMIAGLTTLLAPSNTFSDQDGRPSAEQSGAE